MSERILELAARLVIGRKRDGRSIYDEQAKQELILACRTPGVSMAKLARDCGINANQLSSWVRQYERRLAQALPLRGDVVEERAPEFVPVHIEASAQAQPDEIARLAIRASLPNGVVMDLRGCGMQQACELIEVLGRLPCSASTKA